ncbi:MAG: transposase [Mycobacteriales bacterium]
MRSKTGRLTEALTGRFTDHHAFLLARMLSRVDAITADIATVQDRIDTQIAPFASAVARRDEIPGIGVTAARAIIAEIGPDMTRFPTPAHLASWAKFAPRISESAGARRAAAAPDTATATSPAHWAKPPSAPAAPTRSSASVTGASPDAAARSAPSSRSAVPSWSSSGTCSATIRATTSTSARATTTRRPTPNGGSATTSANSAHSATPSPSPPPPDQQLNSSTARTTRPTINHAWSP